MRRVRGLLRISLSYNTLPLFSADTSIYVSFSPSYYYFWDRFYPYMSYLSESASHIRLQEFSVGYNLPKKVVAKIGMKSLQVYAQCNNPFNIYFNGYGEDPEFAKGTIRLQASYTFGIKCKF